MGELRRARKSWLGLVGGLLVFVLLAGVEQSFSQSVGEIARRNRERRESQPRSTRVFTNEDLTRPHILESKKQKPLQQQESTPAVAVTPTEVLPASPAQVSSTGQVSATAPFSLPEPVSPTEPVSFTDGTVAPPDLLNWPAGTPLGDIARYYRRAKELRENQELANRVKQQPRRFSPAPRKIPKPLVVSNPLPLLRNPEPIQMSGEIQKVPRQAPVRVRVERGDSLWKLARRHLGDGNEWQKIASANPQLADPNLLRIGQEIHLPPQELSPVAAQVRVAEGDSLWKLAATQLGNGQAWSCLAVANPQIQDANLIYPGQLLTVPTRCDPTS